MALADPPDPVFHPAEGVRLSEVFPPPVGARNSGSREGERGDLSSVAGSFCRAVILTPHESLCEDTPFMQDVFPIIHSDFTPWDEHRSGNCYVLAMGKKKVEHYSAG